MRPDIDTQSTLDKIKNAGLGCVPETWKNAYEIYKLAALLNKTGPELKKQIDGTTDNQITQFATQYKLESKREDVFLDMLRLEYIKQIEQVLRIKIEEKSYRHATPKKIGKRFTAAKLNARNFMKDRPLPVARKISSEGYEQFFPEEKKLSIASITQAKKS